MPIPRRRRILTLLAAAGALAVVMLGVIRWQELGAWIRFYRLFEPLEPQDRPNPVALKLSEAGERRQRPPPTLTPTPTGRRDLGSRSLFAGRVTSESKEPLEGVVIEWTESDEPRSTQDMVQTDKDGTYLLEVNGHGPRYRLSASGPGWAPSWRGGLLPGSENHPTKVDFVLRSGHWITGRVIDPTGSPIEGVRILAKSVAGQDIGLSLADVPLPGVPPCETDMHGRFQFRHIIEGKVHLEFEYAGWISWSASYLVDTDIAVVLRSVDGVIRGRVEDAETHEAIPSFTIRRGGRMWRFNSVQGKFQIERLKTNGTVMTVFEAPGYAPSVLWLAAHSAFTATVPEQRVALSRGHTLRGVVRDGDTKEPLPGVTVLHAVGNSRYFRLDLVSDRATVLRKPFDWRDVLHDFSGRTRDFLRTRSAQDGSFELLENQSKWTIAILHPGRGRVLLFPTDRSPPGAGGTIYIDLYREATLSGQLSGPGGRSAEAEVSLWSEDREEQFERVRTDADGKFRFARLSGGDYIIRCALENEGGIRSTIARRVTIQRARDLAVEIGSDLGSFSFSGRLRRKSTTSRLSDAPVPGAEIHLTPAFDTDYTQFGATTDVNGNFLFKGLEQGRHTIQIFTPEGKEFKKGIEIREDLRTNIILPDRAGGRQEERKDSTEVRIRVEGDVECIEGARQ